ncbi:M20 family metallopeptidase [Caproicibacterium sp. NSD3]
MSIKKEQAITFIDEKSKMLTGMSDFLWDHPEIGYHETKAAKLFCETLQQEGFTVERPLAGIPTAFSGTFGSGAPIIGFLGEFDALPGLSQVAQCPEKKAVEVGGAGHGCGHNLLGVGSLAAAIAVKHYLEENGLPGTVKFFGCPAEEGGAGKGFMARDGVFDELDIAFSWHPGEVNSVARESTMANYQACYHFYGISSHAAMSPELGRSALDALELMNTGVQYLREHMPMDNRVHYAITNTGGTLPGVVQPYAEGLYLMRAPQLGQAKDLYERVNRIANGAAMMTDTRVEIEFVKACSNTVLNTNLLQVLQKNLEQISAPEFSKEDFALAKAMRATQKGSASYFDELLLDVTDPEEQEKLSQNSGSDIHNVVMPFPMERQGFASSDVGDVSWVCPVAQLNIATMPAGTAMHSWQEVAVGKSGMAHGGMLYAGKVLAGAAIDVLKDPAIVERAKQEKLKRTKSQAYCAPIPKEIKPKIPQGI